MGVMRKIIDWCDDTMGVAYAEESDLKGGAKAFASGFVEGFCDAAVVMYVPVLIGCYIWKKKALEK